MIYLEHIASVEEIIEQWINPNGKLEIFEDFSLEQLHALSEIPVIYVGTSTCGKIAGALQTLDSIKDYLHNHNIAALIIEVGCLGLCSEEPMVDVQLPGRTRLSFSQVTKDKVSPMFDMLMNGQIPSNNLLGQYTNVKLEAWNEIAFLRQHKFLANQKRLVLEHSGVIDPTSLNEYIAVGGYRSYIQAISRYTRQEICNLIKTSGLRGRAGGGFPVGQKWQDCLLAQGDTKYMICNAQESDPGAFLDRNILESIPHQLIEGLAIAAYACGASKGIIYIRNEYQHCIEIGRKCLGQLKALGLLGHNIMSSGFNLEIELRVGPGAFVCGEETALIASIEGKRGMPQMKPPYPTESGLFHKPTCINNVESLCNVPLILSKGADWFRNTGTENSKGTKLFAISGNIPFTGLIEVEMGISLHDLVMDNAGGAFSSRKLKAIQLGGPNGWCLPVEKINLRIDYEELKANGIGMGSGGLLVMDDSNCIIDMARYYMDYMQKQSCGKCIPCREGSMRILEILNSICHKPLDKNGHSTLERFKGVMQLESISNVMKDTSLCGLGVTAANPVLSTLKWFREEYEEHIFDRYCKSGRCKELRSYEIVSEKCPGCGICAKRCPANAISGTELSPFFVIEEKCNGCGQCLETCKFSAIKLK